MTIREMEELSKQQQAQLLASVPNEGEYFLMPAGGGADRLYQMRGGTIVGLGSQSPDSPAAIAAAKNNPALVAQYNALRARSGAPRNEKGNNQVWSEILWGGRTVGSFQSEQTSKALSALGLSNVPVVNAAGIYGLIRDRRLKESSVDDLQKFIAESQRYAPTATNILPKQDILGSLVSPTGAIAPENSVKGIQSVFGASWQPSPAFTPALQAKGIYGAVRIQGTNEVYTLGPGGTKETAESYRQKFGTSEQKGIVGEITKEQAIKLGITDTKQTPIDPKVQANITAESLATGGEPIDLSGLDSGDNGSTAAIIVAGAQATVKSLEDYIKLLTPPKSDTETSLETSLEKMLADYTTDLKADLKASKGQGAAQLAEEEKQGVQAKTQEYNNLKNKLTNKLAEIAALEADYNLKNQIVEGKPITLASVQGQQSQNYKMYLAQKNSLTAEAGLIQAQALAAQGDLSSAQAAADRATELRFSDIKTRLDNQIILLNLLEGRLNKDEEIRAEALRLYLQDQKDALDKAKQTEKDIQSIMLTAAENGAPSNLLSQISNAKSVVEATQKAGAYIREQEEKWSEPYLMGGDYVQKNLKTGQIRTAVNVAGTEGGDNKEKKLIDKFKSSALGYTTKVASGDMNREDIIRQLKTLYPDIDPRDIEAFVYYEVFPDEYYNSIYTGIR